MRILTVLTQDALNETDLEGVVELNIIGCSDLSKIELPDTLTKLQIKDYEGLDFPVFPQRLWWLTLDNCKNIKSLKFNNLSRIRTLLIKNYSEDIGALPVLSKSIRRVYFRNCYNIDELSLMDLMLKYPEKEIKIITNSNNFNKRFYLKAS